MKNEKEKLLLRRRTRAQAILGYNFNTTTRKTYKRCVRFLLVYESVEVRVGEIEDL